MLAKIVNRIGLPLLTKEMLEQAARKRTDVLRAAFAAAMVLVLAIGVVEVRTAGGGLGIPGRGRELFDALVGVQFFGIYAIIPGIAAGAISVEKERNTLQLLLLTKLGPWTIIFEKLLSRLVPVLMLLLTAVPVMALGRTTHFVIVFRRLLCRFVCQWRCGGVGSSIATVAACR